MNEVTTTINGRKYVRFAITSPDKEYVQRLCQKIERYEGIGNEIDYEGLFSLKIKMRFLIPEEYALEFSNQT